MPADGEGAQRAGGDGVDADAGGAEVGGEVAHAGLERRLGHAHDVVVRDDLLGAVVGHRHQRPAPGGEQRLGGARQGDQRVGADVEGELEALARRLDEASLQVLARGEGERVDDGVEAVAPALRQRGEDGRDLRVVGDVARQDQVDADRLGQRPHPLLDRLVRVGQRQRRALGVEALGDRPGDAVIVGDAEDGGALAGQERTWRCQSWSSGDGCTNAGRLRC